ncbi:MAG TPA: hypothetical protein VIY71_01750 [Solirubrobacterales bacterium]
MKRVVGIGLLALALLLCPVWVTVVPESEPEIGAVTLIAILYIAAFGLILSVDSSSEGH